MTETVEQFTKRKAEHINIALKPEHEAIGKSGLNRMSLTHEALPNINFSDIDISSKSLSTTLPTPLLVSSMTAGHAHGKEINFNIASACQTNGWLMGVGSQRRQLFDKSAAKEWIDIRKQLPDVKLLGNIGIAQIITSTTKDIQKILEPLEPTALFVHTNPLQECIQPEGTTNFKGSLIALEKLCKKINVPVILKETGCGFSQATLVRLKNIGLAAVDISGFGGPHWGRVEGERASNHPILKQSSDTYANWGVSTLDSVQNSKNIDIDYELWASGGIRSGLDVAKMLALGASTVGIAKPILKAALEDGIDGVVSYMQRIEYELKIALFCSGYENIKSFKEKVQWQIIPK